MLTRCPSCDTTFRITPEQLKAKQGRVRCGKCQNVFNAIESLADAPAAIAVPAMPENDVEIGVSPARPEGSTLGVPTFPEGEFGAAAAPIMDVAPASPEAQAEVEEDAVAGAGAADAQNLTDYEPAFDDLLAEPVPPVLWPWVLGAMIALLGLGAQATYHFRTEIAVLAPEFKPAMQELCATLGCDLPLPRKAELIGIETSDLHPDPANAARLQLVASLRNRAPFAQEYPHLELTLTDAADKALVRRVLSPADYRPASKSNAPDFAANGELAVSLILDVTDVAPIGYRLYVFYP